jgi:hypothetical protein
MDIYDELKEAGAEMENHESDLYVKVTTQTTKILVRYAYWANVRSFKDAAGQAWYDIPFAYKPFWETKKRMKRR